MVLPFSVILKLHILKNQTQLTPGEGICLLQKIKSPQQPGQAHKKFESFSNYKRIEFWLENNAKTIFEMGKMVEKENFVH